ncbi:MAG TPA: chemotaxis protein CheB, partial [Candidatus Babeliaceae bacterium]|nr:chemotaxis protein CheB [Candidatus Babeliaceae bacterium]
MENSEANKNEEKSNSGLRVSQPGNDNFFIAGIGASAGGIQALREFFEKVPPNSGMAYVVILHLSPDHDSKLAEVLQGTTIMHVTQV